jgi:lysophospholipase L1-like esterase
MSKIARWLMTGLLGGGNVPYDQQIKNLYGSSLIQYLPGWDASGLVAEDISGNGRNGAYTGTPVLGAVGIGDGKTAWNVNAASEIDAYSAELGAAWNPDAGLLSWWCAANNAASWTDGAQYVMSFFGASATYYYQFRKNIDGTITAICRRNATIKTISIDAPTTNRLINYKIAWDTANDRLIAYVNGTKQRPLTGLGTWSGALAAAYARFGDTSPGIDNRNWPGRMAKMQVGNDPNTDAINYQSVQAAGQVIFEGDSRSTLKGWPSWALEAATPTGDFAYGKYGFASYATSGATTALMAARAAEVDALLAVGSPQNVLVVWIGVNDGAALTAQQIYDNVKAYCLARRAAGCHKILLCSDIDSQANMTWHNTTWPAYRALTDADHSFADGYADLGADPRLQNALDLTYYNADKIHLTAAGYAVVAGIVAPVLAALI